MSSFTATRSILRSATIRNATARIASTAKSKSSPSPFRMSTTKPSLSTRLFSCPVEISSMQPYHTATASALMTSMLTLSRVGYGWLPEEFKIARTELTHRKPDKCFRYLAKLCRILLGVMFPLICLQR